MAYYKVIFSPTGGTRKAADILAENIGSEWTEVDLSQPIGRMVWKTEDVCIVAVPSFGGRVPGIAVERLKQISGNGSRAILLCVYGKRAYEDTLSELQDVLEEAGFCPIAAVAAVAEHSIMHQFAAGRPDAEDNAELVGFAEKMKGRLAEEAVRLQPLPGSHHTYKEYKGSTFKPEADNTCSACGLCAASCPVGAIAKENPGQTDAERCISCMRCIAVCPKQARKLNGEMVQAASQKMEKVCFGRKRNELFF